MKKIVSVFAALFIISCAPKKGVEIPLGPATYQLEIDTWHQKRVEELKGPKGWLNIAGLFWLKEGINGFGSGQGNDVLFPEGKISDRAGFFVLKQGVVTLTATPGTSVICDGQSVNGSRVVFHPDSAKAAIQEFGSLQWFIIQRDNKFGVRLRDFKNPELENFKGIERYPVSADWRIQATLEKVDSSRMIDINTTIGQTIPERSQGILVFVIEGKEYRLETLGEGDPELSVIFGDATNAKETYGAGRYLDVKRPGGDGKTIIDFNKAYNPPCAFIAFATCPLPPKQNILTVPITAGEKNYEMHL